MKEKIVWLGLALVAATLIPSAGLAAGPGGSELLAGADQFFQRTDVDEVLLPPAPDGPATQIPFCAPSAPICP